MVPWRYNSFGCFLRLPVRILLYLGLGHYTGRNRFGVWFYASYSTFVVVFCLVFLFAPFRRVDWSNGILDRSVSHFLTAAVFLMQCALSSMAMIHAARTGKVKALVKAWKKYRLDELMTERDRRWTKKWSTIVFIYAVAYQLAFALYTFLMTTGRLIDDTSTRGTVVWCAFRYGVVAVCIIFVNLIWLTPQYLFFVVIVHMTGCWRAFGARINNMAASYKEVFQFTVEKHQELSEVVNRVNKMFGFYVFSMFATCIPIFLSNLYMFAFVTCWGHVERAIMVTGLVSYVVQIAMLASPSWIYEAASGIYDQFYPRYYAAILKESDTSENRVQKTAFFLEHLRAANVGVSPFGAFTIRKSLVLGMVSIMVSYYVTMAQVVYQDTDLKCESNGTRSVWA